MDRPTRKEGELLKWTNYLIGWQPRWFVLDGNVLSYCISEAEVGQSCKVDSYDHCRFEIVVPGEQCFYLRARTTKERQEWLIALGTAKSQSGRTLCIPPSTSSTPEDVLSHHEVVVEQILAVRNALLRRGAVQTKDQAFLDACNNFLEAMDALPPDKTSADEQVMNFNVLVGLAD